MRMPLDLFDFSLPEELIAQKPMEPRDHSRLFVVDRDGKRSAEHRHFYNIVDYLQEGDVLVMNDSKVFKARLQAKNEYGTAIEVLLVRYHGDVWEAMVSPGRRLKEGMELFFEDGVTAVIESKNLETWTSFLSFTLSLEEMLAFTEKHGTTPLPPYISPETEESTFSKQYQTVYAKDTGSVAAPTAGLHFTPELLKTLRQKGVQIAFVTLHVGMGTFHPIHAEFIEDHEMHAEYVELSSETAGVINRAKREGRRVIAVGTTSTRVLEGVPQLTADAILPETGFVGDVNIFIRPGFQFRVIDGLITNFHLPKSSLMVLVSAFAGREHMIKMYEEAVQEKYRFFSFGDAMLIL